MTAPEEPRAPLAHRVITFYSYKGGVGRSMALANVAALLAGMGRRVLVIDFDLEAPGIERYFTNEQITLKSLGSDNLGLVHVIDRFRAEEPIDWRRCVTRASSKLFLQPIDFILSGKGSPDYLKIVQGINWDRLFSRHNFGDYLAGLREEWRSSYDVVLIDSRTGMSDIGGICTILLPDALVMVFTANNQSIEGTTEVIRRARAAQETLPVERGRLLAIPMLSRDDRRNEYEQSEKWRAQIARQMADFFRDWVSDGVSASTVLQKLYLPQVAYWSFGERLPVIERPREREDPSTLGAAYSRLAALIDSDLDWRSVDSHVGEAASPQQSEFSSIGKFFRGVLKPPITIVWDEGSPKFQLSSGFVAIVALYLSVIAIVPLTPDLYKWVSGMLGPSAAEDVKIPAPPGQPDGPTTTVDDPAIVTSVQIALADREEAFVRMAASGAIPRNAALSGGDFSGRLARLSGCVSCDLGDAKLPKVAFDGGFFSETSFAGAILDGATFIAATLEGVDFSGVDLSGVDFTGAKFSQVRVDSATTIREGQLTPEQKKGLVGAPKTVPAIALPAAEANPTDQVLTKGLTKGWDVDVFWCDTASREQNYAGASTIAIRLGTRAASGASLAPGIVLGRIRLRMWDKGRQAQTGVTQGRLVVYDKGRGEAETARVLQPIVQERSAPFQVALSTRAPTPTYISVFVCGAR